MLKSWELKVTIPWAHVGGESRALGPLGAPGPDVKVRGERILLKGLRGECQGPGPLGPLAQMWKFVVTVYSITAQPPLELFQHFNFSTFQLSLKDIWISTFQLLQHFNFSTFQLSLKDTESVNFQLSTSTFNVEGSKSNAILLGAPPPDPFTNYLRFSWNDIFPNVIFL